jgi:hypothetical protein
MAFDFIGAISGQDFALSFALVLLIIYFLWFFSWGKKQVGTKIGIILAIFFTYLIFVSYPEMIWVPFILFIVATFGKEFLERIPKGK